jgi:hypothetical protein
VAWPRERPGDTPDVSADSGERLWDGKRAVVNTVAAPCGVWLKVEKGGVAMEPRLCC